MAADFKPEKKQSSYVNNLVSDALAIEEQSALEAGSVSFMARMLVQATMPHTKQKENTFTRVNGDYVLSMYTASELGLPFGAIPRLLLSWLTTEAVKTGERELVLGDSMSEFMRQLDLAPTGGSKGNIKILKEQTKRLFSASISCTHSTDVNFRSMNLNVVSKSNIWWESQNPSQRGLWDSTVTLNQDFFDEIINKPVPVDMRALKALKRSPFALDIYTWLTYRMSYLGKRTEIPYEALMQQFGSSYSEVKKFKYNFLQQLKKVQLIYPDLKLDSNGKSLILFPSKTHITKK